MFFNDTHLFNLTTTPNALIGLKHFMQKSPIAHTVVNVLNENGWFENNKLFEYVKLEPTQPFKSKFFYDNFGSRPPQYWQTVYEYTKKLTFAITSAAIYHKPYLHETIKNVILSWTKFEMSNPSFIKGSVYHNVLRTMACLDKITEWK